MEINKSNNSTICSAMDVTDYALEFAMKSSNSDSPISACFLRLDRGDDTAERPPWRWLTSQRWSLYLQSTDLAGVEVRTVLCLFTHTVISTPDNFHLYVIHQHPLHTNAYRHHFSSRFTKSVRKNMLKHNMNLWWLFSLSFVLALFDMSLSSAFCLFVNDRVC